MLSLIDLSGHLQTNHLRLDLRVTHSNDADLAWRNQDVQDLLLAIFPEVGMFEVSRINKKRMGLWNIGVEDTR